MIRRPPRSTRVRSSAASDVYKRQILLNVVDRHDDAEERALGLKQEATANSGQTTAEPLRIALAIHWDNSCRVRETDAVPPDASGISFSWSLCSADSPIEQNLRHDVGCVTLAACRIEPRCPTGVMPGMSPSMTMAASSGVRRRPPISARPRTTPPLLPPLSGGWCRNCLLYT